MTSHGSSASYGTMVRFSSSTSKWLRHVRFVRSLHVKLCGTHGRSDNCRPGPAQVRTAVAVRLAVCSQLKGGSGGGEGGGGDGGGDGGGGDGGGDGGGGDGGGDGGGGEGGGGREGGWHSPSQ